MIYSIRYRLQNTTKKEMKSIYARLQSHGHRVEVRMKHQVRLENWNADDKKVRLKSGIRKKAEKINKDLRDFATFFEEECLRAQNEKIVVTKEWLKDLVTIFYEQPTTDPDKDIRFCFIPFVELFIEESETTPRIDTGELLSKRTIQDYQGTLKKLMHFQKVIWKRPLKHSDITLKFHGKFIKFCREYYAIRNRTIGCLLYTSPSPRDLSTSRMPSSA